MKKCSIEENIVMGITHADINRSINANDQSRKTDAFELVRFLYTNKMAKLSTVPNIDSSDR